MTRHPSRLSVLDQSPVPEGCTPGEALQNTLDLARLADQLGYERFWIAEHHGTPALASSSPEAVIGPVAMATSRISVGSGGVMLPHYSPFKVAETFSMLAGLFPGRIDLGIGRAAGTTPRIALRLQRDRRQPAPDDFREQLDELLSYVDPRPSPDPFAQARPVQFTPLLPSMLGSSGQSAEWAAELGLPYVFADFINPLGASAAAQYREEFRPSPRLANPQTSVAVWVICADTDEEALRLSASMRMMSLLMFRGQHIKVPPVERAIEFIHQQGEALEAVPYGRRIITGSPATVRARIEAVAEEYGAGEVFAVNILYDHQARRRSYELLAGAFDLAPR